MPLLREAACVAGGVEWLHWPCAQKSGLSPQPTNAPTARKARSFRRTEFVGRARLLQKSGPVLVRSFCPRRT